MRGGGAWELSVRGVYLPPMGGKSTDRSIRKQSVPHILSVFMDDRSLGVAAKEKAVVLREAERWSDLNSRADRAYQPT
jgi:hypothetical protein